MNGCEPCGTDSLLDSEIIPPILNLSKTSSREIFSTVNAILILILSLYLV